jgi:hypothetical protein
MKDGQFLLTQYGVKVEIDITPYDLIRTYVELDQGFDNLDENLNDVVNEYFFLGDDGFGSDFVTGIHPQYVLSGVRVIGDPAQDFIFGNKISLMAGRNTNLRITISKADGTAQRYTNKICLKDMKTFGGATTDGAAVECTLSFMGAPFVENVPATETLTVTSVAVEDKPGFTVLNVEPVYPDAGCKYVYTYGVEIPAVIPGMVITTWNDFKNGEEYEMPNGNAVCVAMVNVATFKVVGVGVATVVSGE